MENRIYPRQGTDADLFERLSEYISYFDKDWTKNIEGATDEEIEKICWKAMVVKDLGLMMV